MSSISTIMEVSVVHAAVHETGYVIEIAKVLTLLPYHNITEESLDIPLLRIVWSCRRLWYLSMHKCTLLPLSVLQGRRYIENIGNFVIELACVFFT